MYDLTEEWLERINEEFRKNDIPHKRPRLAWREWAKYTGISISQNDEVVKKIFAWFENNAKANERAIHVLLKIRRSGAGRGTLTLLNLFCARLPL